jgi:Amt family ammonium transporter
MRNRLYSLGLVDLLRRAVCGVHLAQTDIAWRFRGVAIPAQSIRGWFAQTGGVITVTTQRTGETTMNQADTAWMLISTALVLLMTPALAFFYGGLVRSKNALNTMMMSFISLGFVGVLWAVVGYSLAFSPGNDWLGDLSNAMLNGVGLEAKGTIPAALFMSYQGTFAIITAALISGAIVERMRFSAYVAFISLWAVVVYSPIAHWVWGGGWLSKLGALDFAGGTVVHVNAAVAALVASLVIGKRQDYPSSSLVPHNVPFVLLGAGLLWFGWFGFNAGSALAASPIAGLAFVTTMLAPAATLVVWTLLDVMRSGKPTAVGAATAIVVGLVAVTPAAGFISPMNAILLGAIAAVPSYIGLIVRAKTSLDDSLDVVAAHGVGGTVGALLTGVFAQKALNGVADGALYGNPGQLGIQAAAVLAAIVYSGVVSFILLKLIGLVLPLRATDVDESEGLDITQHGEEAYLTAGSGAAMMTETSSSAVPVLTPARSQA